MRVHGAFLANDGEAVFRACRAAGNPVDVVMDFLIEGTRKIALLLEQGAEVLT